MTPANTAFSITATTSSGRPSIVPRALRLRVRDICRQVCRENEVDILRGVLSSDHIHMFVSVRPKLAISDLVRKMKGRSSYRRQPVVVQFRPFESNIALNYGKRTQ
uniref:IS200/IS605 family transposase n=1 Tax=Aliiroseovarius crassostreae TaxID=154981 RepID=UPI000AC69DB6|nr:IS200/IS605 family transposase [Aliiroseovarius crassostreae]